MLKTKKSNLKGMSFVEVIIAIFIFAVVMFAVMTIFTSSFGGYKKADNMAKNIENAQFVMNSMAKSLRTSMLISPDPAVPGNAITIGLSEVQRVRVYDFSENACKEYYAIGSQVMLDSVSKTYEDTGEDCAELDGPGVVVSPITSQPTSVNVRLYKTGDASPLKMGRATIMMKVCSDPACATGGKNDDVSLQTTVSFRDYTTVGL